MKSEQLKSLVVDSNATIRDAMVAISSNSREVVLVGDETLRIVGLVTDGDIRRGMLAGLSLGSPVTSVMSRSFISVGPDIDRSAVLDLMKAQNLRHIPALDKDGRLVAMQFMTELIGGDPKTNIAVVMAGGKGVRLRPFTETVPKPMIEVAGRPMLERTVNHLVGHGVRKIYMAVNYLAEIVESHFGNGERYGCRIEYLRENVPLGTGGALSLLPAPPSEAFLVLNGDLVTDVDITAMLRAHENSGNAATMGISQYAVQVPFGVVTEEQGRFVSLQEKPSISFTINSGIYVFNPDVLSLVPRNSEFAITALFDRLQAESRSIGVFYIAGSWIDVGRPTDLQKANGFI